MFGGIGVQEMLIIGVIAVLLFGKKLPDVAKTLGGSYREFRKGLFDIQSTFNSSIDDAPKSKRKSSYVRDEYDDYDKATAPKFEAPKFQPPASTPTNVAADSESES